MGINACDDRRVKLMLAIENGEIAEASKILEQNDDNDILRPLGPLRVTALQLAAWQGEIGLLDELYKRGADVNAEDKIGRCALFYAAHRGNAEVVKWLLQRGATVESRVGVSSCSKDITYSIATSHMVGRNLPLPECWGRTPLHQAVKNNHPNVVRILTNAGANLNVLDDRGMTPLLLASSTVNRVNLKEVSKFDETIEILVSAKASTNVIHPDTGTTALHHAAALGSCIATKKLLEAGARPLCRCKSTGSTPLHIAASNGNLDTLMALLTAINRTDVDVRDKINRTPLHRASYQGHRECARALIEHGGNLAAETKIGVTVIDAIFAHVPRPLPFLTDILDSRVRLNRNTLDSNGQITVDFSILAPKDELQMGVVAAIIQGASDEEQLTILQHPLVETFLRLKWSKLRGFFFLLLLVHVIFVVSLSSYAIILIHHATDCSLSRRILASCSSVLLFHNMAQVLMVPRHYLIEFETWLSLICTSISLVISVTAGNAMEIAIEPGEEILNGPQHPSQWVLHSISVAILLGWMQMMLLVGRFPTWGYYALMFSTVLKNILKVLLAFVCLIVGFALSFAVLFHGNDQFRDSWRAVVKTVVMMMGEYEYGDLFSDERNGSSFLPTTSRLVFLAFVMLASIVLMNLMIGLAVNDIQGLEKEGHVRRLLKQAEFVAHLERVTSHRIFRSNWLHPRLRLLLNSRRVIPTKITFGCHENYFHESSSGIPAVLVEALLSLASKSLHENESTLMTAKYANNNAELTTLLHDLEQKVQRLELQRSRSSGRKLPRYLAKRNRTNIRKNL